METHESAWIFLRILFASVTTVFILGGLIRGWQMAFGKRLDLVTTWDYRPIPNAAKIARKMGAMYIGMGLLMSALLIMLALGQRLAYWGAAFGVVLWVWIFLLDKLSNTST